MNKITHEGNDYEVLSIDRINEITHARLAGGKVVDVKKVMYGQEMYAVLGDGIRSVWWEELGIQPLKLLERKPVEFVAGTAIVTFHGHDILAIIPPDDAVLGMKFRCTQIVEVTK